MLIGKPWLQKRHQGQAQASRKALLTRKLRLIVNIGSVSPWTLPGFLPTDHRKDWSLSRDSRNSLLN